MKEFKRKLEISYNWWNYDGEVRKEDCEALDEHALEHIERMRKEGYTSGQLIYECGKINYEGWWKVNIKTIIGDEN